MTLNCIINKIFGKIEYILYRRRVSPLSTFYLNFRTLPISQAIKFPIWVYGRVEFASLNGRIILKCNKIKSGMIKLGRHRDDYTLLSKRQFIRIDTDSSITFNGYTSIASDFLLRVTGKGNLEFGEKVWIGQGVRFDCTDNIFIGQGASITYHTIISDSNHHYVIDEKNIITRMSAPIKIGAYNWIGNNSVISKGCKTSAYTIVTHGSLLNKDYPAIDNSRKPMVLAGEPAKIIGYNKKRVFESKNEKVIKQFFENHPNEKTLFWNTEWSDDVELKYFL